MAFCDNCGHVLKPTAKFCGSCGTPITEEETTSQDTNSTYTDSRVYDSGSLPKPESMGKAKAVGVLLVFVCLVGVAVGGVWWLVTDPIPTLVENVNTTMLSKEEIMENSVRLNEIGYKELFRNNEAYVGTIIHFGADVGQVLHTSGDNYQFQLATTKPTQYNDWERNMVFAKWSGSRVLVDDSVRVYGMVSGIVDIDLVTGQKKQFILIDILILNDEFHS